MAAPSADAPDFSQHRLAEEHTFRMEKSALFASRTGNDPCTHKGTLGHRK